MKRIIMTVAIVLFGMQALTTAASAGSGDADLRGSGHLHAAGYTRVDFVGSGTMKVLGLGRIWILPGVEYSIDGKVFVKNQVGAWRTLTGNGFVVLRLNNTWAEVIAGGGPASASTSIHGSGNVTLRGPGSYTQNGFIKK